MGLGKERIKSEGSELLMDAFQFLGISSRDGVPNSRSLFRLRSNKVKYERIIHKDIRGMRRTRLSCELDPVK
jgi:hypothetical protein